MIEDLNVLDVDHYFKIIDLSIENKVSDIMVLLNNIINKGFDGGLLIGGLAKHVRNVLMAKDESTLPLLEVSDNQRVLYKQQAAKCEARFLYQALRIMNQCDINYRQSSNKRLLVELTLIEVAQITQPEDTPSAGRRPRRLKSLFKNLIQQTQPQQRTPQVVPAGQVQRAESQQQIATAQQASEPAKTAPTATYSSATRPVLKTSIGKIGNSWNNLREQSNTRKKMHIIPGTLGTDDPNAAVKEEYLEFTQHDLEFEWLSMCNRMPQQLTALAARMKNMKPVITTFPEVEVDVDNKIMLEQIENIKGSILKTLKHYLHNNAITFTPKLVEHHEQVKILSRREQFEEITKQYPAVQMLKEILDLDLA